MTPHNNSNRQTKLGPKRPQPKNKKRQHFGPYTIKEVLELKMLFDSIDEDGSGEIELQEFLTSHSWQASHLSSTASTVFNTIDSDSDGKVGQLTQFLVWSFALWWGGSRVAAPVSKAKI